MTRAVGSRCSPLCGRPEPGLGPPEPGFRGLRVTIVPGTRPDYHFSDFFGCRRFWRHSAHFVTPGADFLSVTHAKEPCFIDVFVNWYYGRYNAVWAGMRHRPNTAPPRDLLTPLLLQLAAARARLAAAAQRDGYTRAEARYWVEQLSARAVFFEDLHARARSTSTAYDTCDEGR